MIPSTAGFLTADFKIKEQPSKNYKMQGKNVRGFCDEIEAMKQTVFRILQTERYVYPIYSWNYGVELMDLYGKPMSYAVPELERRITEALTWDERITGVSDFKFDTRKKGVVSASFTVHTIFGDFDAERTVNV